MCLCAFAEKLCMFTNRCKLNTLHKTQLKSTECSYIGFQKTFCFFSKQLEQTLYTNTHTASVPITKNYQTPSLLSQTL